MSATAGGAGTDDKKNKATVLRQAINVRVFFSSDWVIFVFS
jgi:hypothetical protein